MATSTFTAAVVALLVVGGAASVPDARADDPLAPIRASVNQERAGTVCPALTYNAGLEAAAQALVRAPGKQAFQVTGYDGTTIKTWGYGDPEAEAIKATYANGAGQAISNCTFTEFGVGFIRDDDNEEDTVGIVFGAPKPPTLPPGPDPNANPTLTPVPAAVPLTPPTNAVQVSFTRGLQWTVNVTSTANIPGTCTYSATNPLLPGTNRNFTIDPRGKTSFTVMAPPPLSVYRVVVACSGPFDGKTVEFGRVEQDVRA